MLLLFLRGYLALHRSLLLRGGLRLCLLHHAALLAKSSGGVASAPTRIAGTVFRLLQQNEKNIFRINETCMGRRRARHRRAACARAQISRGARRPRQTHHRKEIFGIEKVPVKWPLHERAKFRAQTRARHFDSMRGGICGAQNRRWAHRIQSEKKVAQIPPGTGVRAVARA